MRARWCGIGCSRRRERAIEQIERLLAREDLIALPRDRKHIQLARRAHPRIKPLLPFPLRDVDLRAVIGRQMRTGEKRCAIAPL